MRQRVLIVDDEADILRTTAGYLAAVLPKADILQASSGADALKHMSAGPVDLVLSDYKMPGMDGLAFLQEVARQWPGTLTILMTAFPDKDVAIRAVNEGHVRRFLPKPVEPDTLRVAVSELLEGRQAAQQRDQALRRATGR